MANDSTAVDGDHRYQRRAVRAQRVDNPAFEILAESLSVHLPNGLDVARLLVSDFSQRFLAGRRTSAVYSREPGIG